MQHTLACPPVENPPADSNDFGSEHTFNVVIAYEDFETGKHAKRTYDFLVDHLGQDCEFKNQMWKFDVLSIPKLREIAADDARNADIVVISCHGDELPEHLKQWMESWAEREDGPPALVALFDRTSEENATTREVRAYLADVARRGHMEFFAQPDEVPVTVRSQSQNNSTDFRRRALSTLADGVHSDADAPRPRWTFLD